MQPPIENPPEGEWHCPLCPALMHDGSDFHHEFTISGNGQHFLSSDREHSVASTSRSVMEVQPTSTKSRNKKTSIRVQSNLIQHGTCALWASGHLLHSHQSRMFRFEHHDDRPRPRWLPYTRSEAFLHIGPFNKCVITPLTRPRSRERIPLTHTHFFCSGACQFHCNRMQARMCASNNGKKGRYAPKQGV